MKKLFHIKVGKKSEIKIHDHSNWVYLCSKFWKKLQIKIYLPSQYQVEINIQQSDGYVRNDGDCDHHDGGFVVSKTT